LIHLVGLHHLVVPPALVSEAVSRVLEPVPQLEQLLAVAAQLAGELGGGHPLGDASEDHHQLDGPPLGALKERPSEGVEHPPAARATVIDDRVAVAVVDDQPVARPTPGAGPAVGVQPADERAGAGALVHQVRDREIHGGLRFDRQVGTIGSFDDRRADQPGKAATTGSPPHEPQFL
jgi:hypothetical protein